MGSPSSPLLLAVILMDHLENKIDNTKSPLTKLVVCWHYYVDYVFCILKGMGREFDHF